MREPPVLLNFQHRGPVVNPAAEGGGKLNEQLAEDVLQDVGGTAASSPTPG